MNSSTATLEVAADLAETIKANAMARQQSLDEYLREMIEADKDGTGKASDAEIAEAPPPPNYAMLEALRRVSERSKDMPFTSGDDTLKMLREARAGAMFGYEPAE